jgi:hypothetical protein
MPQYSVEMETTNFWSSRTDLHKILITPEGAICFVPALLSIGNGSRHLPTTLPRGDPVDELHEVAHFRRRLGAS